MGELIRTIGELNVGKDAFSVELNKGNSEDELLIHIQNKRFRFECTKSDFNKIAATILFARANLFRYKDNEIEADNKIDEL